MEQVLGWSSQLWPFLCSWGSQLVRHSAPGCHQTALNTLPWSCCSEREVWGFGITTRNQGSVGCIEGSSACGNPFQMRLMGTVGSRPRARKAVYLESSQQCHKRKPCSLGISGTQDRGVRGTEFSCWLPHRAVCLSSGKVLHLPGPLTAKSRRGSAPGWVVLCS